MSKETIQIKALIQTELDTDGTLKKVSGIQQALKKMTLPDTTRKQFEGLFENLNRDIERVNSQLSKGFSVKGSMKNFNQMTQSLEQSIEDIFNAWNKLDFDKISLDGAKDIREEIKKINKEISELSKKEGTKIFSKFEESLKKLKGGKAKETGGIFKDLLESGDLKQASKVLDEIIEKRKKYAESKSTSANIQTIQADLKVFEELKKLLEENSDDLTTFQNKMNGLESGKADAVKRAMELLQKALSESGVSMKENVELAGKLGQGLRGVGENANQAARDMDSIKDRIKYFFSLNNAISLVRQTLRQTFEQIKELDAAMTETAVVTDFSVGDMWDMLPKYTQMAKELGATTKGVYETMTLFYQQGLDTNEVVAIGTETLKMARIAGMDYEEATSKMTAALRGFNMELNELSAQKVNDVYSELAAITAADTDQIATAMTKTASIADSANMEFETTAAFLAQIIETTQESAETAGTAMKTVIARFTELKKDPSLIGEIDGEVIDANKIETALKSVGVPLRDVNGQFRDLDDVFLDIAKRWKGLDTNTQRYIATIAAGSRQQSRFIAMMSDYDRTIELVDRAYDSSGASARQFAKTQDSLEAKLNVLKNTWTEFLTGLMNSDAIKLGVETLTFILELFNKLTTGSTGLMGSLLKVFMAFKVFKLGKVIFKSLFSSINTEFFKAGQDAKKNFEQGFAGAFKSKATFSFGKTFQKVFDKLHLTSKKTFSDMKFSVADYAKYASSHGPEAMGRFEQSIRSLEAKLHEGLSAYSLTGEGQTWADGLVDGFINELKNGTEVNQAIQNLNNKVNTGLNDPSKVIKPERIGNSNFDINNYKLDADELDAQAMVIEKLEKKTQAWSAALTSVGTVMTAFGNELEESGGSLGTFGSGLSVLGDGASAAGMALGVLPGIFKAIGVSLSTGPLVAITAVVAAITIAISAFKKYKENQEEARQAAIDNAEKSQEETEKNRELAKSLNETVEAYKNGEKSRQDVADAADELIDKYDLESQRVQLLTGNYEALTKAILDKRRAEEQQNVDTQTTGIEGVRGQLYGQLGKLDTVNVGLSTSDEIAVDENFSTKITDKLVQFGLNKIVSVGSNGILEFSKNFSDFTDEELVNLSKFLKSYLAILGSELEDQGKEVADSEVYQQLAGIIAETTSNFDFLSTAVEGLAGSIGQLAEIDYEQKATEINDIDDYYREKGKLIELLKNQGMGEAEAEQYAIEYFSKKGISYAGADSYIVELEAKWSGSKDEIELLQKYLSGEVSAETFIRLIGQIDIENSTGPDDINTQVGANLWKTAVNGADDFANAAKGISEYLNENFTLDGIDPNILSNFESQLKILQDIFPDSADLIGQWNQALKGGTLGISNFIIELQDMLNNKSADAQMQALYQTAYGVAFSKDTIIALWNEYNKDGTTEQRKKDILKGLNLSSKDEFENVYRRASWTDKDWDNYVEESRKEVAAYLFGSTDKKAGVYDELVNTYGQEFADYYQGLSESEKLEYWSLTPDGEGGAYHTFNTTVAEDYVNENYLVNVPNHFSGQGETWRDWEKDEDGSSWQGYGTYQQYKYYGELKQTKDTNEVTTLTTFATTQDQLDQASTGGIGYASSLSGGGASAGAIVANWLTGLFDKQKREQKENIDNQREILEDTRQDFANYTEAIDTAASEASKAYETNKAGIGTSIKEKSQEYHKRENERKAAKNATPIEELIDIEGAKAAAASYKLLETQLFKIKELTADGPLVDVETFQQLMQIAPEIANGAAVGKDGLIDISKGIEKITGNYGSLTEAIREKTRTTLMDALTEEQGLQIKLEAIIKELDTKIALAETSDDKLVKLEQETVDSINGLSSDAAFERAQIAEQEEKDISDSSYQAAVNVVDNVLSMDRAYTELGNTVGDVHNRIRNLGNIFYNPEALTVDLSQFGVTSGEDVNNPNADNYTSKVKEKILAGEYSLDPDGMSIEEAKKLRNIISGYLSDSYAESGEILVSLSNTYAQNPKNKGDKSGGDKEIEKFDTLFNILQKITRAQELRNKLEKEYNKLLEEEVPNYEEIQKNLKEREALLAAENLLLIQKKALNEALLQSWIADNAELSEYVWYDENLQKLQIDAAKINEADAETREKIDKAMEEGEKIVQDIADGEEEIYDTELELEALRKAGINDLDKQLNKVEEINEAERDRNKTESEIEILTNQRIWEEEEYLGLLEQENQQLDDQVQLTEELAKAREQDLKDYLQKIQDQGYGDLMSYDFNTNMAILNKELFDALPAEEQSVVQKVFDGLVDISEDFEDATDDAIEAIVDNTAALKGRREEAIASVEYVKELLLESRQREIDFYQEASDVIADSNSKILDSITESLELQRQDRENAKTEEELADMRNRLAYLQMDTSGANASEILSLQEQLKEKEEDYTDTLIDQKIDELERQNDLAAEQRERQISLMEWQLKNDEDSGELSRQAYNILNSAFDDKGNLIEGSKLDVLIQQSDAIQGLSTVELNEKMADIQKMLLTYFRYMTVDRLVGTKESGYSIGQDVSANFGLAEGTAKITGEGEVTFGNGYKISGITSGGWDDTSLSFAEGIDYQELYANAKTAREVLRASVGLSNASGLTDSKAIAKKMPGWDANRDGKISAADARLILRASVGLENLNDQFYNEADLLILLAARDEGISSSEFDKMYKDLMKKDPVGESIDSKIQYFIDNLLGSKKFATGGLADFTGPAWLDGTKSRPELVLNQRDTQNFLQLKDILASFMSNNGFKNNSSENRGDNYYEIHLNVEKITSDYDVEQLANKVKSIIAEDANSRGVNSIYRRR